MCDGGTSEQLIHTDAELLPEKSTIVVVPLNSLVKQSVNKRLGALQSFTLNVVKGGAIVWRRRLLWIVWNNSTLLENETAHMECFGNRTYSRIVMRDETNLRFRSP